MTVNELKQTEANSRPGFVCPIEKSTKALCFTFVSTINNYTVMHAIFNKPYLLLLYFNVLRRHENIYSYQFLFQFLKVHRPNNLKAIIAHWQQYSKKHMDHAYRTTCTIFMNEKAHSN